MFTEGDIRGRVAPVTFTLSALLCACSQPRLLNQSGKHCGEHAGVTPPCPAIFAEGDIRGRPAPVAFALLCAPVPRLVFLTNQASTLRRACWSLSCPPMFTKVRGRPTPVAFTLSVLLCVPVPHLVFLTNRCLCRQAHHGEHAGDTLLLVRPCLPRWPARSGRLHSLRPLVCASSSQPIAVYAGKHTTAGTLESLFLARPCLPRWPARSGRLHSFRPLVRACSQPLLNHSLCMQASTPRRAHHGEHTTASTRVSPFLVRPCLPRWLARSGRLHSHLRLFRTSSSQPITVYAGKRSTASTRVSPFLVQPRLPRWPARSGRLCSLVRLFRTSSSQPIAVYAGKHTTASTRVSPFLVRPCLPRATSEAGPLRSPLLPCTPVPNLIFLTKHGVFGQENYGEHDGITPLRARFPKVDLMAETVLDSAAQSSIKIHPRQKSWPRDSIDRPTNRPRRPQCCCGVTTAPQPSCHPWQLRTASLLRRPSFCKERSAKDLRHQYGSPCTYD